MSLMRALLRPVGAAASLSFSLSFLGASCAQPMLGLLPDVINDPRNLSLRRSLLAEGAGNICDQIQSRSTPFRFRDQDPIVGRFFPTRCVSRKLPTGELHIELLGQGYVWTNMSRRLGFEASAAVEYDTDFQLSGSTIYAYFRPRATSQPIFYTRFMEIGMGGLIGMLTAGAPGQSLPDRYGSQIMAFQLQRGFTVIRDANGGLATDVGVLPPGERPLGAYTNLDPDKATLANERVELHNNERDFAGPFTVPAGKRLSVTMNVDGAPAVDLFLVARPIGDAWLTTYTHDVNTTPPPGPVLLDDVVPAGSLYRRPLDVPPGQYFLVIDNTASAGRTTPSPVGDARVVVSYAVQLE